MTGRGLSWTAIQQLAPIAGETVAPLGFPVVPDV